MIYGCKTSVIPNSVTEIGEQAFRGSGVKSIVIPKSVKKIGAYAFYFCSFFNEILHHWEEMESVVIEADLEEIDRLAIDSHIKYLTLMGSIDNVRDDLVDCLDDLYDLEAIYVPYGKIGYCKSKLPRKYHKLLKKMPKVEKKK